MPSRGTYAFRDLDDDLHGFITVEREPYLPHHSPTDAKNKSVKTLYNLNGLSDSIMVRMYADHYKAQRRRKFLGGALFVGVALLGIAPMLMEMQSSDSESALELALSKPYRSIRVRGEKDPESLQYDPFPHYTNDQWIRETEVGDEDPTDQLKVEPTPPTVTVLGQRDEDDGVGEKIDDDTQLDSENRVLETQTSYKQLHFISENRKEDDDVDDMPSTGTSP